jgi:hypothetical protein
MSNNKFYVAFVEFLKTHNFGDYAEESFGLKKGRKEYDVSLRIEESSEMCAEKPRFTSLRRMLNYIAKNGEGWIAADNPSARLVGYTDIHGDRVTISLTDVKRGGGSLTDEERKCLQGA